MDLNAADNSLQNTKFRYGCTIHILSLNEFPIIFFYISGVIPLSNAKHMGFGKTRIFQISPMEMNFFLLIEDFFFLKKYLKNALLIFRGYAAVHKKYQNVYGVYTCVSSTLSLIMHIIHGVRQAFSFLPRLRKSFVFLKRTLFINVYLSKYIIYIHHLILKQDIMYTIFMYWN